MGSTSRIWSSPVSARNTMISSVNKMTSGYARSLGESLILASTFHMTHASIIVIQHNLHPGRIIQFFEYFFTKK